MTEIGGFVVDRFIIMSLIDQWAERPHFLLGTPTLHCSGNSSLTFDQTPSLVSTESSFSRFSLLVLRLLSVAFLCLCWVSKKFLNSWTFLFSDIFLWDRHNAVLFSHCWCIEISFKKREFFLTESIYSFTFIC